MAQLLAAILPLCLLLSSVQAAARDAQGLKFLAHPSKVNLNQMVSNPNVDGEQLHPAAAVSDPPCHTSLPAAQHAANAAVTPLPADRMLSCNITICCLCWACFLQGLCGACICST
jgi:hypothetical protein